jgi:hypothetical protein
MSRSGIGAAIPLLNMHHRRVSIAVVALALLGASSSRAQDLDACQVYQEVFSLTADSPSQLTLISAYASGLSGGVAIGSHLVARAQVGALTDGLRRTLMETDLPRFFRGPASYSTPNQKLSEIIVRRLSFHFADDAAEAAIQATIALHEQGAPLKLGAEVAHHLQRISPTDLDRIVAQTLKSLGYGPNTTLAGAALSESAKTVGSTAGQLEGKVLTDVSRKVAETLADHAASKAAQASPALMREALAASVRLGETTASMSMVAAAEEVPTTLRGRLLGAVARATARYAPGIATAARFGTRISPPMTAWTAISIIRDGNREKELAEFQTVMALALEPYFQGVNPEEYCAQPRSTPAPQKEALRALASSIRQAREYDLRMASFTPAALQLNERMFSKPVTGTYLRVETARDGQAPATVLPVR